MSISQLFYPFYSVWVFLAHTYITVGGFTFDFISLWATTMILMSLIGLVNWLLFRSGF